MAPLSRKISTVLAADVVDYSRHMESSELRTVEALKVRREIFSRIVERHGGREFGTVGDSMMAELPSAIDAVSCAVELQKEVRQRNASLSRNERMLLRVGVNLGDVHEEDGNLYGTAVNMAARLEQLARPGRVLVSGAVYDAIKTKGDFGFRATGPHKVKNISEPITAYLVTGSGISNVQDRLREVLQPYRRLLEPIGYLTAVSALILLFDYAFDESSDQREARPPPNPKSIAILPFEYSSAAGEDSAFFASGLQDDLLMRLGNIADLRIISPNSAVQYRDSSKSTPAIAEELNVASVLYGKVQQSGERVKIAVTLVAGDSNENLWAETFEDRLEPANLFEIQARIASEIARRFEASLTPAEQQRLASLPTETFEALRRYWIARDGMDKRTTRSLADAESNFNRAISLDSDFLQAYVGLADTYLLQVTYSGEPREEMFRQAKDLIDEVLNRVEETGKTDVLAQAHASRGYLFHEQGDYPGAEIDYTEALRLNPSNAQAQQRYGILLLELGRGEEALDQFEAAAELDPLSPIVRANVAEALAVLGRFDDAVDRADQVIEDHPDSWAGYWNRAFLDWTAAGRLDEAFSVYRQSLIREDSPDNKALFSLMYLDLGDAEQAACWANQAWKNSPESFYTNYALQNIYLYRRQTEKAFEYSDESLKHYRYWWRAMLPVDLDTSLENREAAAGWQIEGRLRDFLGGDDPVVDRTNFGIAIDLAYVLTMQGNDENDEMADRILDEVDKVIDEIPRLGFYGYWIDDARVHAIRGEFDEALEALEEAVDDGWRFKWWYFFDHDPVMAPLRRNPDFRKLREDVADDMAEQLEEVRDMEQAGALCNDDESAWRFSAN